MGIWIAYVICCYVGATIFFRYAPREDNEDLVDMGGMWILSPVIMPFAFIAGIAWCISRLVIMGRQE